MSPLGHMTAAAGTVWIGGRLVGRSTAAARRLVDRIDYRLVLLGALLPDLIDKPIGWVIWRDHFDANGHRYGHTLLATLVLIVPGVYFVLRDQDPRLFAMGIAMLSHLAVDPTNHSPESLLWPLLGTDFPKISLLGPAATVATETVSALMLLSALLLLRRQDKLRQFVRAGRID